MKGMKLPQFLVRDSSLHGASRIAVDGSGVAWVPAGTGNRLVAVKPDGSLLGAPIACLSGPRDVVVDRQNEVWVSNFEGGTVVRFAGS